MGAKSRLVEASAELGLPAASLNGPDFHRSSDIVLFVHGITADAMTWPLLISRLPSDVATISVDLRGRGESFLLDGPWGMANHASDLGRLLESLGIDQKLLVVGHSMGAFVASTFALLYPDYVRGLVLVDGGIELSGSLLSLSGRVGSESLGTSRVDPEAVYQDGTEIFLDSRVLEALEEVGCPVELLRAEKGMSDLSEPLISQDTVDRATSRIPELRVTTVPAVNHYTIVLSPAGADAVAAAIHRQL